MSSGYGPAVLDGKLRYVSPSQIERFDPACDGGCPRKWAFRYLFGLKERPSKAAMLGTQVHSQIEHYLKTGENVLGPIAMAGFRFLPEPGNDLLVEVALGEEISGNIEAPISLSGIPIIARIDLIDPRVIHIVEGIEGEAEEIYEPGILEINDHKTTSDIDQYAKSGEELSATHQMLIYGKYGLLTHAPSAVRLSHTVYQTRGMRAASKRSDVLTPSEVEKGCSLSESVVEWMKSVAGMSDIRDIPPNFEACDAFGGCQFRDKCPRDDKQLLVNFGNRFNNTEDKKMGLLDKYKTAQPAAVETTIETEKASLLAEEAALVTPPDIPQPSAVADIPKVEETPTICQSGKQALVLEKAKKYHCPCGAVIKIKPVKLEDGRSYAFVPKHDPPSLSGGGGDGIDPAIVVPSIEDGLSLYLDCMEDGATTYRLENYVTALAGDLARELNGDIDIRCAGKESPLAFGAWRGLLAAKIRETPPRPGNWAVSSASELGMVAFETLIASAKRVIRGVR